MADQGTTTQPSTTADASATAVEQTSPPNGSVTTFDLAVPFPGFVTLIAVLAITGLILVVVGLMRGRPRNKP